MSYGTLRIWTTGADSSASPQHASHALTEGVRAETWHPSSSVRSRPSTQALYVSIPLGPAWHQAESMLSRARVSAKLNWLQGGCLQNWRRGTWRALSGCWAPGTPWLQRHKPRLQACELCTHQRRSTDVQPPLPRPLLYRPRRRLSWRPSHPSRMGRLAGRMVCGHNTSRTCWMGCRGTLEWRAVREGRGRWTGMGDPSPIGGHHGPDQPPAVGWGAAVRACNPVRRLNHGDCEGRGWGQANHSRLHLATPGGKDGVPARVCPPRQLGFGVTGGT